MSSIDFTPVRTCKICSSQFEAVGGFAKRWNCPECRRTQHRDRKRKMREIWATLEEKTCSCCKLAKPTSDFATKSVQCRDCSNENARKSRAKRSQDKVEKQRAYDRAWKKEERKRDPEKVRAREYEKFLKIRSNPKKLAHVRKCNVARNRERRKSDPKFRMMYRLRARLWNAVRQFGDGTKRGKTLELTGCTKEELMAHLESQFTEGMTWDSYGLFGWHIDHIKPCKDFDLSKEEEQRKCFHYTNLRPLWWQDNLARNRKYGNHEIGNGVRSARGLNIRVVPPGL